MDALPPKVVSLCAKHDAATLARCHHRLGSWRAPQTPWDRFNARLDAVRGYARIRFVCALIASALVLWGCAP